MTEELLAARGTRPGAVLGMPLRFCSLNGSWEVRTGALLLGKCSQPSGPSLFFPGQPQSLLLSWPGTFSASGAGFILFLIVGALWEQRTIP